MPHTPTACRLRNVAATVALTCCGAAWAQGEVVPVEAGECELEFVAAHSREAGARAGRNDEAKLACGVGAGSELALAVGRARGGGEARAQALLLEGKTTLDALQRHGPGVTWVLAGGVTWEREAGRGWRGAEAIAQLELARELAAGWWLEATIGGAYDIRDRRRRTTWSAALERGFGEVWAAKAELDGDDREPPTATLELMREFADGVDAGIATHARLGAPRERGVEVKLTIGF